MNTGILFQNSKVLLIGKNDYNQLDLKPNKNKGIAIVCLGGDHTGITYNNGAV
jgi:hypothetical protein